MELTDLTVVISSLLRHTQGADRYNEIDQFVEWDKTAEGRLLQDELYPVLKKLEEVKDDIEYLNKPILKTGILNKNSRDRYETDYMEYTSGSGIEALIYDPDDENEKWVISRVEHNGDYYIVGYPKVKMDGLKVRIRK